MKATSHFDLGGDVPMMQFDEDVLRSGWKAIYLGLYSPFSNKYTQFIDHAIQKAKEEHSQRSSHPFQSKQITIPASREALSRAGES